MADVRHDADNLNLARIVPGNREPLPERIVSAEERSRRSPIQDADVRSAEAVLIAEIPAHQHGNAHGPEVVRHHDGDVAARAGSARGGSGRSAR